MKILHLLIALFVASVTIAQQKPTDLDKSPLDVVYYPANYPILKMRGQGGEEPAARVIYSRPQRKGREIFGGEVKYGEIWRMGANEATELELFKPAKIGGKKIPKGRYTLYCIPTENKWTVVINKDNYNWGSFIYKPEKDVARVDATVQKMNENVEAFTVYFDTNNLNMLWEDLKVSLPINF